MFTENFQILNEMPCLDSRVKKRQRQELIGQKRNSKDTFHQQPACL